MPPLLIIFNYILYNSNTKIAISCNNIYYEITNDNFCFDKLQIEPTDKASNLLEGYQ
ncbi:MAG TPA: hypothetical protein PKY56_02195 [Candidatus Kapabacteria bacterium]|nr:hypothetical protein [Candidatus Kapabacteria bacterium]